MNDLDQEWLAFADCGELEDKPDKISPKEQKRPECSDIYISTKTKIAYLSEEIKLNEVFWKLPIIPYHIPEEGIVKKSMKINCLDKGDTQILEEKLKKQNNCSIDIICKVDNPSARRIKYKDVRKINVGISLKDLLSFRKKKKGAFYNCFALIMRVKFNNKFKEVHVKVFNTGKLEIPGIKEDELLFITLNKFLKILSSVVGHPVNYCKKSIENVLINSNFNCGFFIDRSKLFNILKYKYNVHSLYDPCSYPGIQCKYYHNINNSLADGQCKCEIKCGGKKNKLYKNNKKNKCLEISFMIFRTGSILIVGHCDVPVLKIIYGFIKKILLSEYENINIEYSNNQVKKVKTKKIRKRNILVSI
jgi:TATA-box binding protein (TBP) (component of TFIID and TFIIIB)